MTAWDDGSRTDAASIAELVEDNRRLRLLLDQRDAPGELRHRLRSTLGLLRAVIRRSATTARDLPGYVAQLEDRVDAISRAQAQADLNGEVDFRTLLTDELLLYGASEGDRLKLTGPDVGLRPRAGQIMALALHELAVNAIEHGALGRDEGRLDVSWSVAGADQDGPLLLTWIETGALPAAETARSGFGTEVLTRMLPYEFEALTDIEYQPGGLRCTIHLKLDTQGRRALPV